MPSEPALVLQSPEFIGTSSALALNDLEDAESGVIARSKISTLVSRNVTIDGHRTSCRLEPTMWEALYDVCARERINIHALCTMVNQRKDENTSLTAAIRVFALAYFRAAATEDGHQRVEHGYGRPFKLTPFPESTTT